MASAVHRRIQELMRGEHGAVPALTLPRASPVVLERIRDLARELEQEPGLTAREVAERVGLQRRQVVLLLLRLEEHGHVVREGRRWFPGAATVH